MLKYNYVYVTKITHFGYCDKTEYFYVGKHSTNNLNDGYTGSGNQIREIKRYITDNPTAPLRIETSILEMCDSSFNLDAIEQREIGQFCVTYGQNCLNIDCRPETAPNPVDVIKSISFDSLLNEVLCEIDPDHNKPKPVYQVNSTSATVEMSNGIHVDLSNYSSSCKIKMRDFVDRFDHHYKNYKELFDAESRLQIGVCDTYGVVVLLGSINKVQTVMFNNGSKTRFGLVKSTPCKCTFKVNFKKYENIIKDIENGKGETFTFVRTRDHRDITDKQAAMLLSSLTPELDRQRRADLINSLNF